MRAPAWTRTPARTPARRSGRWVTRRTPQRSVTASAPPGTGPAYRTRPLQAARTTAPTAPARSAPRCDPVAKGAAGEYLKLRVTSPGTGRCHRPAPAEEGLARSIRAARPAAMERAAGCEVTRMGATVRVEGAGIARLARSRRGVDAVPFQSALDSRRCCPVRRRAGLNVDHPGRRTRPGDVDVTGTHKGR